MDDEIVALIRYLETQHGPAKKITGPWCVCGKELLKCEVWQLLRRIRAGARLELLEAKMAATAEVFRSLTAAGEKATRSLRSLHRPE